jgi:PEP-CTERM motif
LLGLAFTGANFGPTTNTSLNLDTFSLTSLVAVFNPFDFRLTVNFAAPAGAGASTFSADLLGAVLPVIGGFVKIDFVNNGPTHFVYGNGGSFDLSIADVTLTNGTSRSIRGTIANVVSPIAVPEPGTLALFGLGLVGLGFARRRRATN